MSRHLYGIIVTNHGTAANNRAENEGNITTLQKILWNGQVHTTVSAEAIRFAIRWYWQQTLGEQALNRRWNDHAASHTWADAEFAEWEKFADDDVLGFMSAKAAKQETNEAEAGPASRKTRQRGTCDKRRARLEITRALSLTPFAGEITFSAASVGATPSASSTGKHPVPYGTEVHATRYQYGFALTPETLSSPARALNVIEALVDLSEVAGNHARFLYDFSPDAVIFRWTDDFAPRMLYTFGLGSDGRLTVPEIIRRVKCNDIDAKELIVGGSIARTDDAKYLKDSGAAVCEGVKQAAVEVKKRMRDELHLGV